METVVLETLRKFMAFKDAVYRNNYDKLWLMKPLVKGNELIRLLNIAKPGIYVHRLLCELVVWQVMQIPPNATPLPELNEVAREESVTNFMQSVCMQEAAAYLKYLDEHENTMLLADTYPPKLF